MSDPRAPQVRIHSNIDGLGQSPTMAINELCAQMRRNGREVFRLGLGQSPFPVAVPVVEELRANAHRKEYLPVCGLAELREAVAGYHSRTSGVAATAEDVLIGPGSKELMFLLQVVHDGDLIVPTPAWVSYAPQAGIVGRPVRFLHTDRLQGWRLEPAVLEAFFQENRQRSCVLILNYPGNPTGETYGAKELQELAAVAQRYGVVVLSDEIYGELHHKGEHVSIAKYYPEGTIISGGLSKWCGAGGWRLGTFTFPAQLRGLLRAMAAVASETYTSTSAPIQYAAVRAFQGGIKIERYLWHARRILAALATTLANRLVAAGTHLERPAGAFYLFPDFSPLAEVLRSRGIRTSDDLCRRLLLDTGVAMLPGSVFGRAPEELTARLAYVDFDGARALAAAETQGPNTEIGEPFLSTYCGGLLKAVDRVCDWLMVRSEAEPVSEDERLLSGQLFKDYAELLLERGVVHRSDPPAP